MGSVFDTIRGVRDVAKGIASIDDRMRLMEAIDSLSELREENDRLTAENETLRKRLATRKALERRSESYFVTEDDWTLTGPVCPKCYEERDLVLLLASSNVGAECYSCHTEYPGVKSDIEGRASAVL